MSRWHSSTKKGKKCKGGDEDEDANTSKAAKAAEAAARAKAAKAALDAIYASLEPSEDKAAPVGGFVPQACPLLVLGEHIVAQVLRFLSAASLEASVRTCRELRCIGAPIVPGLRLTLFPHQRSSLCWMRERELERAAAPSDLLLPLRATSGRRVWLQRGDCCWRMEEPPLLPPVRGGMLCDEPGLGKTITVLSLLLRTRGCLPLSTAVPEISEAERWSRAEEKWRHWGNLEKARELARIVRDLWVCEGERGAAGIYNRPVKKPPKPLTSPPAAVRRPEVMVAAIASAAAATVAAAATAAAAAAAPFDPEREGEGSPAVWGAAAVAAAAPSPVPNAAAEPVVLRLPVSPGGAATAGSEVGGDRGDAINGCGMSNGGSGGCFGDETAAGADQLGNGHGDGNGAAASGAFPAGKKAPGRAGMSKCVVRQVREAAAGPEADLAAVDLAIQKDAYPTLREFRTDVETVLRRAKQEAAARGQRAKDEAAAAAAAEVALAAAAVVAGPAAAVAGAAAATNGIFGIGAAAVAAAAWHGPGVSPPSQVPPTATPPPPPATVATMWEAIRTRAALAAAEQSAAKAVHATALVLQKLFNSKLQELVAEQLCPPDADAARKRALLPSTATLIVVPPAMLRHWQEQLQQHTEPGFLGEVFYDEDSSRPLPPAEQLAANAAVVTTYQRLTNERARGDRSTLSGEHPEPTDDDDDSSGHAQNQQRSLPERHESPLQQVLWLRMVTDEGHQLGGASAGTTNVGEVARGIEAERRWVMTGTPTSAISVEVALRNVANLLVFMRDRAGLEQWRHAVEKPFLAGSPEGTAALGSILRRLMVRHTKARVWHIPPPVRTVTLLTMSQQEALAYNTVVNFVRTNLVMTHRTKGLRGRTPAWQDCLFHPNMIKHARIALRSIQISCCGGGALIPELSNKFHVETITMLRDLHGRGPMDVLRVNNFICRALAGEVSSCQGCGVPLQMLCITPCAHLVCADCVDIKTNICKVCGVDIDPDDFQRLQPGFVLTWRWNVDEQEKLRHQRRRQQALQRSGGTRATAGWDGGATGGGGSGSGGGRGGSASGGDCGDGFGGGGSARNGASCSSPGGAGPGYFGAGAGGAGFTGGGGGGESGLLAPSPSAAGEATAAAEAEELNKFEARLDLGGDEDDVTLHSKAFYLITQLEEICRRRREHSAERERLQFGISGPAGNSLPSSPPSSPPSSSVLLPTLPFSAGGTAAAIFAASVGGAAHPPADAPATRGDGSGGEFNRPVKAIVFSLLRHALNTVGDKLYRHFGGCPEAGWLKRGEECVAEFWGKNKARELWKFKHDDRCFVMLLGKDGACGLDLSFVTHIFLLEEVLDRSVLEQVVARAHRMGATGAVRVNQLVMKGTCEELMHQVAAVAAEADKKERGDAAAAAAAAAAANSANAAAAAVFSSSGSGDISSRDSVVEGSGGMNGGGIREAAGGAATAWNGKGKGKGKGKGRASPTAAAGPAIAEELLLSLQGGGAASAAGEDGCDGAIAAAVHGVGQDPAKVRFLLENLRFLDMSVVRPSRSAPAAVLAAAGQQDAGAEARAAVLNGSSSYKAVNVDDGSGDGDSSGGGGCGSGGCKGGSSGCGGGNRVGSIDYGLKRSSSGSGSSGGSGSSCDGGGSNSSNSSGGCGGASAAGKGAMKPAFADQMRRRCDEEDDETAFPKKRRVMFAENVDGL